MYNQKQSWRSEKQRTLIRGVAGNKLKLSQATSDTV
jgi:hypothetical protein